MTVPSWFKPPDGMDSHACANSGSSQWERVQRPLGIQTSTFSAQEWLAQSRNDKAILVYRATLETRPHLLGKEDQINRPILHTPELPSDPEDSRWIRPDGIYWILYESMVCNFPCTAEPPGSLFWEYQCWYLLRQIESVCVRMGSLHSFIGQLGQSWWTKGLRITDLDHWSRLFN